MAESDEAAFLASMKAANEAQDTYELENRTGAVTESINTSDEYDPTQAVSTVQSLPPQNAQESPLHQIPSTTTLLLNETMSKPDLSNSNVSSAVLQTPLDPPVLSRPDRQSESRSMSRATTSDGSQTLVTDQNPVVQPPHEQAESAQDHPATAGSGEAHHGDPEQMMTSADPPSGLDSLAVTPIPAAEDAPVTSLQSDHVTSAAASDAAAVSATPAKGVTSTDVQATAEALQNASKDTALPSTTQEPATATATTTLPKARLPHDTLGILEDRIQEDPRGDIDAWLNLIGEYRKRNKLDEARSVYERFFALFPAAAEQWVAYAQMEGEAQNRNGMEKIFQRTLLQIPYLPLWSLYLGHIRRLNNLTTDTSGNARNTIYQAYDLALQQIGLDKNSGQLWQDFIEFIKSGPGIAGGSGWQDQQKMDQLRKVYQRAICVPTQSTNLLWKEYDKFERGLNVTTGQKFLQDQSPTYVSARSSYVALQKITQQLQFTTLPLLPPALGFAGHEQYVEQLETWKRWIEWEKEDPLVLKEDDVAAYRARIIFVYKQALMAMRFWPELWCDASEFCFNNDMESQGNDFLVAGIAANPESCLLAFKRADRLELSTANEEGDESSAQRRAAAVRESYNNVLDALYELLTSSKAREEQDLARVDSDFAALQDSQKMNGVKEDVGDQEDDDEETAEVGRVDDSTEKQKAAKIAMLKASYVEKTRLLSRTLSHVWIACMRAMRRIGGKATFRASFADARKRGRLTSEVYIAVALIEFHCYEPDTARKIFDRGLKLFQEDEAFALAYIKHLVANNDHTNARVTFETAVTRLEKKPETAHKTRSLYVYFHDFESRYGELGQIVKLEKRMRDLFPEDPSLSLFSSRFTDQGFDPTSIRPIISPTQTRPTAPPLIKDPTPDVDQIIQQVTQAAAAAQPVNSPKRPFPDDGDNNDASRPQKLQRVASPLKGAAGRRLDQFKRSQLPVDPPLSQPLHQMGVGAPPHPLPPPPLPRDVTFLLSIIPRAETYAATRFKPSELVRLLRETEIPRNVNQLPQTQQQPQQQTPTNLGRPPPPQPPQPPQIQHHLPQPLHPTPHMMQQQQQRPPAIPSIPQGPPMGYQPYGQVNGQFGGPPPLGYATYQR